MPSGMTRDVYRMLRAAPSTYRTASALADSVDMSAADNTVVRTGPSPGRANPTVAVSCRFVGGAGTTVAVAFVRYHSVDAGVTNTLLGVDTLTATATDYTDGTLFLGDDLLFDTGAATHFEVRAAAPSDAQAVTLVVWAFGGASE